MGKKDSREPEKNSRAFPCHFFTHSKKKERKMKKIKNVLRYSFLVLGLFLVFAKGRSQAIPAHFFGQNAWMPDTIGNAFACTEPPCIFNGKLHKQWDNVQNSGAAMVRFGGIAADNNMPTDYQYIKMIDSIRAHGMEPVMQVPFKNYRYSAQQAAAIVKYVNVTKGKQVKYWSIGNEPDLGYSFTTASQVAAYIKSFATAMKKEDPSIMIMGPECAWFNQNILNGLTTPNGPDDITGKDAYGRYYLDVLSFHTYPFNGSQTRAQVISKLTSAGSLQDNLIYLNTRVASCNTAHNRTGAAALRTAITEANINWQNDPGDNLQGVGANSFIGGQFWAEMLAIAMKNKVDFVNFWSVIEGNNTASNIGYIDPSTGVKKPSYYHFKMLADNFKGNYANGTTNLANVKSFGSQNAQQIAVMIMNQEISGSYNYNVKLNTATIAGNNPLKVNINAGLSNEYSDVIQNQSTVLLVFNSAGALVKKYEYSLNGNAVANLPPTFTQYGTTPVVENKVEEGPDFEIAKVFPNPTNGKFQIQLNKLNVYERKYEIEVFNMEGRLVLTKGPAMFVKGKEEVDLLFTDLASGLYIVRVKRGDILKTAKVVLVK